MNKKKVSLKKTKKPNKNKIVLTLVCIFASITLLLSVTMGTVLGIKSVRAVFSYKGVTLDKGEVSYLTSYYKYDYMCYLKDEYGVVAYDTEEFWKSQSEIDGRTYGEHLNEYVEYQIKEFLVFNYIFDSGSSLSSSDKETIRAAVAQRFLSSANSDKAVFNELAARYGFDYSDFEDIAAMAYKYEKIRSAIEDANANTVAMLSSDWQDFAEDFFENYSHVKLLFIRTEDKYLLDENGNRIQDKTTGNDVLVDLNDEEKAAKAATINEIRSAITALLENRAEVQMSPTMFNNYLVSAGYEGDPEMNNVGYYFYKDSAYTAEFSEEYEDIVNKALEMKENSYAEIAFDGGVCFIYKYERTGEAYLDSSEGGCFSDFYSLMAIPLVEQVLNEALPKIKVKEYFYGIDLTEIPYNYEIIP